VIGVSLEVRNRAAHFRATVWARSIERAISMAEAMLSWLPSAGTLPDRARVFLRWRECSRGGDDVARSIRAGCGISGDRLTLTENAAVPRTLTQVRVHQEGGFYA
jgi:hypothetical protein